MLNGPGAIFELLQAEPFLEAGPAPCGNIGSFLTIIAGNGSHFMTQKTRTKGRSPVFTNCLQSLMLVLTILGLGLTQPVPITTQGRLCRFCSIAVFFGGTGQESFDYNDVAVDAACNIYLVGSTTSGDLPVTTSVMIPVTTGLMMCMWQNLIPAAAWFMPPTWVAVERTKVGLLR